MLLQQRSYSYILKIKFISTVEVRQIIVSFPRPKVSLPTMFNENPSVDFCTVLQPHGLKQSTYNLPLVTDKIVVEMNQL